MDDPSPRHDSDRRLDGAAVERIRAGDEAAFAELYDRWFDRVWDLTGRILRDRDRAAEVSQDAFVTAWQKLDTLDDPASFGGWLLRIARNRALNRSEREQRSVSVDDTTLSIIEREESTVSAPAGFTVEQRAASLADPALVAEDNELVELLWGSAAALGERDTTVLDLQLRHGLRPAEIGEVIGINRNAANQLVHRVRKRLDEAVRARVLWDGDEPACPDLRTALSEADVDGFGAEAVKVVERHVPDCDFCDDRRRLRLEPTALFGAMPLLLAPGVIKKSVAAHLADAGVPVHDAESLAGAGSSGEASSRPADGGTDAGQPSGVPPRDAEPSTGRPRWPWLVAAGVVIVIALVVGGLAFGGDDRPDTVAVGATSPSTDGTSDTTDTTPTTSPDTTAAAPTTAPTTTVGPSVPVAPGTDPGAVAPPGGTGGAPAPPATTAPQVAPPPAPPAPSPAASADFFIDTTTMTGPVWTIATDPRPRLSWSVTANVPVTVQVSGPEGVLSTSTSGTQLSICPTGWASSTCGPVPTGDHVYAITVTYGSVLLDQATATLRVL